jgi:hypothetical protein
VGTRLICRRERPRPARSRRSPTSTAIFSSASSPTRRTLDIAALEVTQRQRAIVEDRVKTLKQPGVSYLRSHAIAANAAWFEPALCAHEITFWTQLLTLDGEHPVGEPKPTALRILRVAGRLTRHARRSTFTSPPTGSGPAPF